MFFPPATGGEVTVLLMDDRQLNQIVSPRNIKLTVMELGWVWCEEWIRASNFFFNNLSSS